MAAPPEFVLTIVQADKEGLATTRIVSISVCNKLVSLGNLCILTIHGSDHVASCSTVTP